MPLFLAPLLEICGAVLSRLFFTRLGQWALTAMVFLGIQFASQKFIVTPLLNQISAAFNSMGGGVVAWIAYLNVDSAITIILSAYASAAGTKTVLTHIGKK